MRVGVLLRLTGSEGGGGFTFEREVFRQLLATAGESHHSFVVLDAPASLARSSPPSAVEFAPAPPEPIHRLLRLARDARIHRIVSRAGVDVVWNLFPVHPVPDVPFITIVWDLQHRLQPLFPEVSAGGEWERRERQHRSRLQRAAAVIAGTEVGRREISAFYQVPEQRIHVLPHPTPSFALDAPPSPPGALDRFRLPERYLLYPAQFWPHKNHAAALLALKLLRERGVELPMVFVGSDQGNASTVRRLAGELGLAGQVRFLGFVSVEELVALYRGALALAYPSLFGPENLPPLEAFALGCPVVAADVPGAAEQLGDAALRVDATRPEAIAGALLRLRDDASLRAALAARGLERARRFTGKDFVRGVYGILDGLAPYVRCWKP
jgi:glycosyltransferase involved in cell wall biosynthesis